MTVFAHCQPKRSPCSDSRLILCCLQLHAHVAKQSIHYLRISYRPVFYEHWRIKKVKAREFGDGREFPSLYEM